MTLMLGVILFLAVFLWMFSARYEWVMPEKLQMSISTWLERMGNKNQSVSLMMEMELFNTEIENRLWLLKGVLPMLQKRFQIPIFLEVQIYSDWSLEQDRQYIKSLQNRFSDIVIGRFPLE
ncbi:hypothetical protein [Desulfosporosinus hippei]|uniref:Uncharacterized protein n=1 Tax=Desulfosporosinus hippei DSM 8344 TaxID=1121419 RepID=A0A1G7UTL2_9FIRM|nr:hypothetical protein [Desulfosporosinus hippei]SDG50827.1 hypothetical protein SAMN05443529_103244 [Desulfosporosinus hippei DSM 8344]